MTLARGGNVAVTLAARRAALLEALRTSGENAAYLPGIALPATIELTEDWSAAVRDADTIVMAVPSRFARAAMAGIAHAIPRDRNGRQRDPKRESSPTPC